MFHLWPPEWTTTKNQKSMDKVLGQEYVNIAERTAFLRDNCDAVEELGYVKPLASEQIEELKDKLVENNIQLRDVRADKRAQNKLYNEQIKQLEEENDGVTKQLKEKSEYVTENCFKFVDGEEVGYYNAEGVLVYQRPARPEEKSPNVFRLQRTGTNG